MNLSLLKYFFEIQVDGNGKPKSSSSNYKLFEKLEIANHQEIFDKYFNKYPVIEIDFKCDLPLIRFDDVVSACRRVVHEMYLKYTYLLNSSILTAHERNYCELWMCPTHLKSFAADDVQEAFRFLSRLLYKHFDGRRCYILIDEYDSIYSNVVFGMMNDDDINISIKFITGIINSLIKSNPYVERGFLTGVSQICSLVISGSNVAKYSFLRNDEFVEHYGISMVEFKNFVEVSEIAGIKDLVSKGIEYYNGYTYKDKSIFNTWSVMQFLTRGKVSDYWVKSGQIVNLEDIFILDKFRKDVESLLSYNGVLNFRFHEIIEFEDLLVLKKLCSSKKYVIFDHYINIFYSFLFENGYLVPVNEHDDNRITAKIPNTEIKLLLLKNMNQYFIKCWNLDFELIVTCAKNLDGVIDKLDHCEAGDLYKFCEILEKIIKNMNPIHLNESCLHFVLFLIGCETSCKFLSHFYYGSNTGYLDVAIFVKNKCIIFESKFNKTAQEGIEQILDQNYTNIFNMREFFPNNVDKFLLAGINVNKRKEISMQILINSQDKNDILSVK